MCITQKGPLGYGATASKPLGVKNRHQWGPVQPVAQSPQKKGVHCPGCPQQRGMQRIKNPGAISPLCGCYRPDSTVVSTLVGKSQWGPQYSSSPGVGSIPSRAQTYSVPSIRETHPKSASQYQSGRPALCDPVKETPYSSVAMICWPGSPPRSPLATGWDNCRDKNHKTF